MLLGEFPLALFRQLGEDQLVCLAQEPLQVAGIKGAGVRKGQPLGVTCFLLTRLSSPSSRHLARNAA